MYVGAQWYSHNPRCGAIYLGGWSFHWCTDGPVKVIGSEVVTVRERPRRQIVVFRNVLYNAFKLRLWPHRGFCRHGFYRTAWWHRCDYVTAENPLGRPSDEELWPEDDLAASPL